eukprot:UN27616
MGMLLGPLFALLCAVAMVMGDTYLHQPRGSNNRLNEDTQNRAQGNRIFDSQNNNKGGYNVGDRTDEKSKRDYDKQYQMSYFMSAKGATEKEGNSYFPIEWTNQHGCGENTPGKPNKLNCNMVLQFMCQRDNGDEPDRYTIRDGTKTSRNNYKAPRGKKAESEKSFQKRMKASNDDD